MTNIRQEWKKFFIWLRNGTCFVTTWLMLLLWLCVEHSGRQFLPADVIPAVILSAAGAVLIFCAVFTKVLIRKFGFAVRFTLFLALVVLFELTFGYKAYCRIAEQEYVMLFGSAESGGWLGFAVIVLAMYAVSMGIYAVYRRKKGALYTQALQRYQQQHAS